MFDGDFYFFFGHCISDCSMLKARGSQMLVKMNVLSVDEMVIGMNHDSYFAFSELLPNNSPLYFRARDCPKRRKHDDRRYM